MSIKVVLADDHPVVRAGIRSVIEKDCQDIEIIGEASNGNEVLEKAKESLVDVYILDISMPELNGIEAAERLMKMDPRNRIIILSIHDSRIFVERALKLGARGYLLKESATEEVIHAIRAVYKGKVFLSPGISKYVVDSYLGKIYDSKNEKKVVYLTKREKEILQLIAEGSVSKEIATKLNIAVNTVRVHRKNIMQKLDIHRNADLIRYAIKEGISQL